MLNKNKMNAFGEVDPASRVEILPAEHYSVSQCKFTLLATNFGLAKNDIHLLLCPTQLKQTQQNP